MQLIQHYLLTFLIMVLLGVAVFPTDSSLTIERTPAVPQQVYSSLQIGYPIVCPPTDPGLNSLIAIVELTQNTSYEVILAGNFVGSQTDLDVLLWLNTSLIERSVNRAGKEESFNIQPITTANYTIQVQSNPESTGTLYGGLLSVFERLEHETPKKFFLLPSHDPRSDLEQTFRIFLIDVHSLNGKRLSVHAIIEQVTQSVQLLLFPFSYTNDQNEFNPLSTCNTIKQKSGKNGESFSVTFDVGFRNHEKVQDHWVIVKALGLMGQGNITLSISTKDRRVDSFRLVVNLGPVLLIALILFCVAVWGERFIR
ncbi:MAG: hypothetical protein ACFFCQ_07075 [Promethearchaeota archaeon]